MPDIEFRPMTAEDIGRIPMDCHGGAEALATVVVGAAAGVAAGVPAVAADASLPGGGAALSSGLLVSSVVSVADDFDPVSTWATSSGGGAAPGGGAAVSSPAFSATVLYCCWLRSAASESATFF